MEKAPCVMIWRADYAMCGNSCNGCAGAKKLFYQTEGRDPNSTYYCAIEDTTIPREQHEEPGHVAEYPAYFARDGAQIHAHTHRHTHRHIQTVPTERHTEAHRQTQAKTQAQTRHRHTHTHIQI